MDPLAGTSWSARSTVEGFARSGPNEVLMGFARRELERELLAELAAFGFVPDPAVPLTEHNRLPPGALRAGGPPVIYEAAFRQATR